MLTCRLQLACTNYPVVRPVASLARATSLSSTHAARRVMTAAASAAAATAPPMASTNEVRFSSGDSPGGHLLLIPSCWKCSECLGSSLWVRPTAPTPPPTLPTAPPPHCRLQDFEALCVRLKESSAVAGISGLIGWDEMVQMPEGAAKARAAQKAALAGVLHEKATAGDLGALLARLQGVDLAAAGLDAYQQATVREAARDYRKATAITKELASREAELESRGYQGWVKARQDDDWAAFAPLLQEWVDLRREKAALVGGPGSAVYDVLLDDYEKGMTAARLDEIFGQVSLGGAEGAGAGVWGWGCGTHRSFAAAAPAAPCGGLPLPTLLLLLWPLLSPASGGCR